MSSPRSRALRLSVGLAISAVFLVATLSRVDLGEVGRALQQLDLRLLLVAVPLVFVELVLRGLRWQRLLEPIAEISLGRSVAYLSIGYFANSMLPARLGDIARAFLAGRALGVSRLGVIGTVVVERAADGLFILGLVAVLGVLVAGGGSLATTAAWLVALAAVGAGGLVVAIAWIRSSGAGAIRVTLRSLVERLLRGAEGLRSPTGLVIVVALTVVAFVPAVAMFALIADAAGVELTIAQCALVMGGLALSTSIPAAPGSIGTYEFVGLTILTTLGIGPDVALAIVVVVHLVATLPVALAGLLASWHLHFRVGDIAEDAEPSNLVAEEPDAPRPKLERSARPTDS